MKEMNIHECQKHKVLVKLMVNNTKDLTRNDIGMLLTRYKIVDLIRWMSVR